MDKFVVEIYDLEGDVGHGELLSLLEAVLESKKASWSRIRVSFKNDKENQDAVLD